MSLKPLEPGHIRFHEWFESPLRPGDYTVKVEQSVKQLGFEATPIASSFPFSVEGPRFALDPSDIYCVYPPKGDIGDFSKSLSHVVFTRRTLPWERDLVSGREATAAGAPPPWMALLVFTDGAPQIRRQTVKELVTPSQADADVVGPKIAAGEAEGEYCNTADKPEKLFRKIAPELGELPYLAHVREVSTGNKETLSFFTDGWFSVVLANRFPKPQEPSAEQTEPQPNATSEPPLPKAVENTVFLISLEGLSGYPAGGTGVPENRKIREAVLASWSFQCLAAFTFIKSMNDLTAKPLMLPEFVSRNRNDDWQYVANAFARGYVALNHNMRLGDRTVSWYRGPVTPVKIEKVNRYKFKGVPDALVRCEYNTRMMDVTYAAASQLGRLLALQDRAFARALCAWRSKMEQERREAFRQQELRRAMNNGAASSHAKGQSESQTLEEALVGAMT